MARKGAIHRHSLREERESVCVCVVGYVKMYHCRSTVRYRSKEGDGDGEKREGERESEEVVLEM